MAEKWCSVFVILARPCPEVGLILLSEAGLARCGPILDFLVPTSPLSRGCWVATRRPIGQMKMKVGVLLQASYVDKFEVVVVVRTVWGRRWLEPLFGGVLLVFLLLRSLVSLCLAMSSDFVGGTQVSWRRLSLA